MFHSIVEKYILEDSKNELNISAKLRTQVLFFYETQNLNLEEWQLEDPKEIFFEIVKSIKNQLAHDPFHRFVRTKKCLKFIEQFMSDSELVYPISIIPFNYKDEYFSHPFVYERDFSFFKMLAEDNPLWQLISSKSEDNVHTFFSKFNYLPDLTITKVKTVKYEGIFPFSLEKAALCIFSDEMVKKYDPNITRTQFSQYFTFKEFKEKFNIGSFKLEWNQGVQLVDVKFPHST
jgi:hypothetical protein